jgi:hypothetical protein
MSPSSDACSLAMKLSGSALHSASISSSRARRNELAAATLWRTRESRNVGSGPRDPGALSSSPRPVSPSSSASMPASVSSDTGHGVPPAIATFTGSRKR